MPAAQPRRFVLTLALTVLVCGCAGLSPQRTPGADEREIYRLLIDDQQMGPNGPILVLEDSLTNLRRQQIRDALARNPDNDLTPSELGAIDDLVRSGRPAARVPADLATGRPYEIGDSASSADARDVLFVGGIGWGPQRDHAVVHVDFFCEGCGWGGLTLFRRGPAGWRIEARRWMWR